MQAGEQAFRDEKTGVRFAQTWTHPARSLRRAGPSTSRLWRSAQDDNSEEKQVLRLRTMRSAQDDNSEKKQVLRLRATRFARDDNSFYYKYILLFTLLLSGPNWLAAQNVTQFKVDVHLVNVFVNVTDASGAPVGGLTRDDFTVAEDGRPQKIAVFERQSEMPLSIVLAIDTSGSVFKDLPIEKRAAKKFVHAMLRPVDRFDLIDFSSDVREVVPFTNKLSAIDNGIEGLATGPATALYSAVYLSAQSLANRPGRRVLVLISDGGNTVKGTDYADALEQAVRSETMVYSIIDVPIAADAGRDTGGEHAMITLSQETGGKYYYADATHLEEAFQKVSEDLRTQYLLGYYSEHRRADSDFRSISVTLKQPPASHYSVRHRTGYYAAPGH